MWDSTDWIRGRLSIATIELLSIADLWPNRRLSRAVARPSFPLFRDDVTLDDPLGESVHSMCDGCYTRSRQWIHNIVTLVPPWQILSTRSSPRTSVASFRVARATHRRCLIRSEGQRTIEIATEVHCSHIWPGECDQLIKNINRLRRRAQQPPCRVTIAINLARTDSHNLT